MDRLPQGPFALIQRAGEENIDLLQGAFTQYPRLADLPVGDGELLALVPYRQLLERDDVCHDDGAPLLAMRVAERHAIGRAELPWAEHPVIRDGAFDVADDDYARTVKTILDEEIARGEGANFVIRRTFVGHCDDPRATALGAFRNLLDAERGAYWTFLIDTGAQILVGATPERHVSLADGVAVMNPISGTFRRPPGTATRAEILAFLADPKERDELAMVVDEELKVLAAVGDLGGRVTGPFLKEMANLAHTEYYIEARTTMDPRQILRETMFAPTATGSPLRNAFRVIKRHETSGRGYYGAVAALISDGPSSEPGRPVMDAPLLLRVAYLDQDGTVRVPVGATLVRGSDPYDEVRETHAKAAGVLRAFGVHSDVYHSDVMSSADDKSDDADGNGTFTPNQADHQPMRWADDPAVVAALQARNANLAPFWMEEHDPESESLLVPALADRSVLIIDNEDAFTSMLAVQLRALGMQVTRTPFEQVGRTDGHDLVVLGPGPGDPRDLALPKIRLGRALIQRLLAERQAVLGVCLGHQMICGALGFELIRKSVPDQGRQRQVDLFGRTRLVGFYNSFAALAPDSALDTSAIELATLDGPESDTRELVGLRARVGDARLAGLQFHPESILTYDGLQILRDEVLRLLEPEPEPSPTES
jgi:2-amino-4-deoxychorismate synthase